jgi:predicted ester cyclase
LSVEENCQLVRRYVEEVLGTGQLDRMGEFLHEDLKDINPGADAATVVARPPGVQGIRQWWETVWRAFPDTRIEVEVLFGEGDLVIEHCLIRGTHTGPWIKLPATGHEVVWEMTEQYRIADGKIIERWGAYDQAALMGALGVLKGPVGAGMSGRPLGQD